MTITRIRALVASFVALTLVVGLGLGFAGVYTLIAFLTAVLARLPGASAQPLLAARGLVLQLEPGLRERNFGCCEGMTISEIEAESPQIAAAMAARHPDYVLPEGESLQQLFDRVIHSVAALAQRCAGQCVAVVAHGGVLEMIYRRVHGIALQPPRSFALPNASINWLAISGEQWVFESWAETAHLGDIPIAPVVTRI